MFGFATCFVNILATQAIIYFGAQIDFSAVPVLIRRTYTQRQRGELVGKEAINDKGRDSV